MAPATGGAILLLFIAALIAALAVWLAVESWRDRWRPLDERPADEAWLESLRRRRGPNEEE